MVRGNDGYFYGTTFSGGKGGSGTNVNVDYGTLFRMTPQGDFTSLYYFGTYFPNRLDIGNRPYGNLIQGSDGILYGTTLGGGPFNLGTVYGITTNGSLTTLYSFGNSPGGYDASGYNYTNFDGIQPYTGVVQGSDGNLYGTTAAAGGYGNGSIFRMTPDGTLNINIAHSFSPSYISDNGTNADGIWPLGDLIQAKDGNFYGTTYQGGSAGQINAGNQGGTVFQLTPDGTFTVLHAFTSGDDGSGPMGGLVEGLDGSLYGTASRGGTHGAGTVFRVTTNGTFTTLHAFDSPSAFPSAALIQASDGNLYGTTPIGGANGKGSVFQMTTNGTITTLHSFNGEDGQGSVAPLVQGADGSLYGTTRSDATSMAQNNFGTIFRIIVPPVFRSITPTNGAVALAWSTMPGQTYQLQSTTNLDCPRACHALWSRRELVVN